VLPSQDAVECPVKWDSLNIHDATCMMHSII
jgi:hypothetical protein